MKRLNETLWAAAKEYARLFGEIISMDPEFWVGDCPDICCFGDTMYFSLEEMRQVVNALPRYIRKYGTREAVGYEIHEWTDWMLEGTRSSDSFMELVLPRVTRQLRPNISLESWLNGDSREERTAWSGPDADYLRLKSDCQAMTRLISQYSPDATMKEVLGKVADQLAQETEAKRQRDDAERRRLLRDLGRQIDDITGLEP